MLMLSLSHVDVSSGGDQLGEAIASEPVHQSRGRLLAGLLTLSAIAVPARASPDAAELERCAVAAVLGPDSCRVVQVDHELTVQVGKQVKASSQGQVELTFEDQVWWGAATPLPLFSVGDFTCTIDPPRPFHEYALGGLLGAATHRGGGNTWVSTVEEAPAGYLVRFDKDLLTMGGDVSRRLSVDVTLDEEGTAVAVDSHLIQVRGLGPGCSMERESTAELGPHGLPRTETITSRSNCPLRRKRTWVQVVTYQVVGACTSQTELRMEPGRDDPFRVCTERALEAGFVWGAGWRSP